MIFRTGPSTLFTATQRALEDVKRDLDRATEVAVTQRQVNRPSDGAGRWVRIGELEDLMRDQQTYIGNSNLARGLFSTAEGALTEAENLMVEARELAIEMASDTRNDTDRANSATRIDDIRSAIIGLANTEFAGRSIFAGTDYDNPAYSQTGVYLGNASETAIVIGEGRTVRGSIAGGDLFTDAINALEDLAGAMRTGPGSADAVAAQLTALDDGRGPLVTERTQLGFDVRNTEDAANLATSLELSFAGSLDDEVSADPVTAFTEFSQMQTAYQNALQVSAQVTSTTLFDFLR